MAFKRTNYRAEWAGGLSLQDKLDFIDDFFNQCNKSNLDGLIIGREGGGEFILEGDEVDVNGANSTLDGANELTNGGVYCTETNGAVYTKLTSHTEDDYRDQS
jgi:hypothetical protein